MAGPFGLRLGAYYFQPVISKTTPFPVMCAERSKRSACRWNRRSRRAIRRPVVLGDDPDAAVTEEGHQAGPWMRIEGSPARFSRRAEAGAGAGAGAERCSRTFA